MDVSLMRYDEVARKIINRPKVRKESRLLEINLGYELFRMKSENLLFGDYLNT